MLTYRKADRPTAYYEALRAIRELNQDDKLNMLVEITNMLRTASTSQSRHSILELEGLGAGLWQQINVDEYIETERSSWNG